jgi:hypothetical protein
MLAANPTPQPPTWRTSVSPFFFSSRALLHCSHAGWLYPYPNEFRHSTSEALHTKRRERPLLAKDGTKTEKSILLATRDLRKLLGSFTCRKAGTWDTYFTSPPKEGMLRIFTAPEKSNSFGRDWIANSERISLSLVFPLRPVRPVAKLPPAWPQESLRRSSLPHHGKVETPTGDIC